MARHAALNEKRVKIFSGIMKKKGAKFVEFPEAERTRGQIDAKHSEAMGRADGKARSTRKSGAQGLYGRASRLRREDRPTVGQGIIGLPNWMEGAKNSNATPSCIDARPENSGSV